MQSEKVNPIIQWWVTPKLPPQDIFELPLLIDKSLFGKITHVVSQWIIHPVKRRLARWYLKILQGFTDIKVIGVTGSAGKSTTVQMIASILKQSGRTVATPPSVDPIYNVPNTILKCLPGAKFLVLEMSVEYPGEMDYYLWLATPDVGVITNIFPTHTEYLKSAEGVLTEKGKLLLSLSTSSVAVLNSKDPHLTKFAKKLKAKVVWFDGDQDPLTGNSQAAMVSARTLGISQESIDSGLKNYDRPKHRLEVIKLSSGVTILDDSYNSNPEAAISALYVFKKLSGSGKKIAVLGDMLELGEYEEEGHRRVGREVSDMKLDVLIGVGEAAKIIIQEVEKRSPKTQSYFVERVDQIKSILKPHLNKNTYILIKGSRSIGLDKLVAELV